MHVASSRWVGLAGRFAGLAFSAVGLVAAVVSFSYARAVDATSTAAQSVLYMEQPPTDYLVRVLENDYRSLRLPGCAARIQSAVAIIHLNILERRRATEAALSPEAIAGGRSALESAARCTPMQAMNWLGLAWIESLTAADGKRHNYLRLSYAAAPREGWLALRRSLAVAAELDSLPEDLRELALADFRLLVANGLVDEAYMVLANIGWAHRDMLLASIGSVNRSRLEPFLLTVERRTGLIIERPYDARVEARPWH